MSLPQLRQDVRNRRVVEFAHEAEAQFGDEDGEGDVGPVDRVGGGAGRANRGGADVSTGVHVEVQGEHEKIECLLK